MSTPPGGYEPPAFNSTAFHCPNCGVYADQVWAEASCYRNGTRQHTAIQVSYCVHCQRDAYWFGTAMVHPSGGLGPLPHADMPEGVREDYLEARAIVGLSPRGACALLRLAVQKLCAELGESGKNINADIGALVKKGLSPTVQQALDVLRVVGNNAVHPGEMDLSDDPETAQQLFTCLNLIAEQMIATPKRMDALYQSLPQGARDAIDKRDSA